MTGFCLGRSARAIPLAAIVIVATSATPLLTGCSYGGFQRAGSALPTAAVPVAVLNMGRSAATHPDTISPNDLFVGEFGYGPYTNRVAIYQNLHNGTFKRVGQIQQGINHPYATWLNSHGLYVANAFAPSITEYRSPSSKPFTYKAGMTSPFAVTTDGLGTVFEADFAGYVNEYEQECNVVDTKCFVSGFATGVASDSLGDAFVAYIAAAWGISLSSPTSATARTGYYE